MWFDWIHKKYSGITGQLTNIVSFLCKTCNPARFMRFKRLTNGEEILQCVNEFCYLGDMLSAGGGAESSSICRVW